MLATQMPYHLRNTVERVELPVFIELEGDQCRVPPNLALGDTLMVLGVLRNYGRPVVLHAPGAPAGILEGHPLIKELAADPQPPQKLKVRSLPVASSGRSQTWESDSCHILELPVLPMDQVRCNHIRAHSLYYNLERRDDWPSIYVDPDQPTPLERLLSGDRPNLVLYPFSPARTDYNWHDPYWWSMLIRALKDTFHLILVGAGDYGELAGLADASLAMDDPDSSLANLAWLFAKAQAFAGRDGGLSHMAAALSPRPLVLWDSMLSYRHWSCSRVHNLALANPHSYRYPQMFRLGTQELVQNFREITLGGPDGEPKTVTLPAEGYVQEAERIFGSIDALAKVVLCRLAVEQDREAVATWMADPGQKRLIYEQSLKFAGTALSGGLTPGVNWVAPMLP